MSSPPFLQPWHYCPQWAPSRCSPVCCGNMRCVHDRASGPKGTDRNVGQPLSDGGAVVKPDALPIAEALTSREVSGPDQGGGGRISPRLAAGVIDFFVYVVVLNLFAEYFPKVISETFTLSLLAALLLKIVLEVVVAVKDRMKLRFRQATTRLGKIVAAIMLWLVLVGSKFVVLEVINGVFGNRVSLGGFFPVTLLILALLVARLAVRRLLQGWSPPTR